VYEGGVDSLRPRDAQDVENAVREALTANQPLDIIGHGTKRGIGHGSATNAVLDLSALSTVTLYEPEELVLTVQAAAPLRDVQGLLATKQQEFAFEPVDTSALLGTPAAWGTVGGMIGAGLAGPRRIKAGGVRDHLLGLHAVSGFGESFKAGGRVVKNVTGYDLCKLIAGSWGTLAVMTEVTLKVMPKAETEITLKLTGLGDIEAGQVMTAALGSPHDVSAAAHLPKSALRGAIAGLPGAGDAATLIRLEGIAASVGHRADVLRQDLAAFGPAEQLPTEVSAPIWSALRDVAPFAAAGPLGQWAVWRIVCPPSSGAGLGRSLARETGGEIFYDWAGGLIWAALPPSADAHAGALRQRVDAVGGHAILIRAPDAVRAVVDVFHPHVEGIAALNRRIKLGFDPQDIFNRGRLARRSVA
jgi:glycolate oxidase FAD binding subunit